MTEQEKYMKAALKLAQKAADEGEVPVGAVVVCDGKIVGRGRNRRETKKNALHHAEIEAIEKACKKLGGWRLHRCDLYVTLEPCPMCAGGGIRTETRVSGGGVSVDREAAYWSQWEHPFSLNPHGRAIEAAVQAEPIKTEQIQHDERYVQLRVRVNGGFCEMQFTPDSLAVFDALIPNLEFDEVALTDRTPTPVEQLDILAGLCGRGFVTREEFEQAKARLLGKI